MRILIATICLLMFGCRAEDCSQDFVDTVIAFDNASTNLSNFEYFVGSELQGKGTAKVEKVLKNLYAIQYDYDVGSDGVFILGYNFTDKQFLLSHVNEGSKIYPAYFAGEISQGKRCALIFKDEVNNTSIYLDYLDGVKIKFLKNKTSIARFQFN